MGIVRELRDLLATEQGRDLLRSAGIFTVRDEFLSALRPPQQRSGLLGAQDCPVYLHQQPSPDFRISVLRKFEALSALQRARPEALGAVYLAIDTDRAASSKAATRIAWLDAAGRRHALKVTPPGTDLVEFRHVSTDPRQLARVAATLEAYVRQMRAGRDAGLARLRALRPHLAPDEPISYAQYAAELGDTLLHRHLGFRPHRILVSALTGTAAMRDAVSVLLANLDGFVRSFNRRIAQLRSMEVATAVDPLPDDYLPFFYSCPVDGQRVRLRRQRIGGEDCAVAETRAGRRYAFPLRRDEFPAAALFASARWSPDVLLPVLLNRQFSGLIAGRSSALYLLVQGAAMQEVLGMPLVPVLVPERLGEAEQGPPGLLQRWLVEPDRTGECPTLG
ncbi:hypothetical protein [Roseicella aquatilis]|uniref:Uncharacterized protein n=1 Tax=Roseicella aquatilis TaxID=2527868 RepID=A0A4R4D3Z6_9PROT|nr:hypothetical protein [Roseicella aquatilis]TCZ54231.1 hypothetical protein EXY23_23645 [Roseicella aquatilis]